MGGGANATDPVAATVHGTNPQFLVHNILRQRIYECAWWKEHCFALSAETLVDKAMQLEYFGGAYGNIRKPSPFLCLLLKMLQIQVTGPKRFLTLPPGRLCVVRLFFSLFWTTPWV